MKKHLIFLCSIILFTSCEKQNTLLRNYVQKNNPAFQYEIKNYLKDHRIFMTATIASLVLGGNWKIHNSDSINTSFPSFLKLIRKLGGKFKYEI